MTLVTSSILMIEHMPVGRDEWISSAALTSCSLLAPQTTKVSVFILLHICDMISSRFLYESSNFVTFLSFSLFPPYLLCLMTLNFDGNDASACLQLTRSNPLTRVGWLMANLAAMF